jgi:DNA-binding transcriptional MocR family regulator
VPGRVDLEFNFSVLPDQPDLVARGLSALLRPDALGAALVQSVVTGTPAARAAAATLLSRAGWTAGPERILFAGNGRQSIAAAIAALVPAGARLGVESLTYPVVKGIAARLGVTLVPLAMDEQGVLPDALRTPHLHAVYLQPILHNPLGVTMPTQRREEIARVLRELDLVAIEDGINTFLRPDEPPLGALAPERVVLADSLSKRLAPGLTLGFLVAPETLTDRIAAALRSGGWAGSRFAIDAATQLITDGTVATIQERKLADARTRQRRAAERLAGFRLRADPDAYHCWWELPEPWRAETFVAAAARHGIAVSPAAAFTVGTGHAPNAVRLALAFPPLPVLTEALDVLATLARSTPEDADQAF